jgi:hypothetical protein
MELGESFRRLFVMIYRFGERGLGSQIFDSDARHYYILCLQQYFQQASPALVID